MRARMLRLNRRGISPVISAIILSAVVIAVGGSVWSYSQGASISVSKDYVKGVFSLLDEVVERFTVENVYYNNVSKTLNIWVYNFGKIDIVADVYANVDVSPLGQNSNNPIVSKQLARIDISLNILKGNEVTIKVGGNTAEIIK
ncbi:hypothetical protein MUP77_24555 [Candidatus Bathyarchaeota archaeon]|nr:hypothetical protein [Candidatus Bathyarchaeota archaeon]